MKKFIILILFFFFFFLKTNASFLFSEIMPNTEDDVNLEYLEIYNNSSETKSLSWYIFEDKSEKQFIFSDIVFSANQKIKFYRSETSILLNNSSEEVFLYDSNYNLVDSFSYETSNKSEFIIIYETDESLDSSDNNIEQGTITNNENLSTGIVIPNFEIEVQSGISFLEWNSWECPEKWLWDCKINLNIENSFENYDLWDFDFLWDFWNAEYIDSTQYKANPWYVTYSDWVFWIIVKVCEAWNINNCKIKSISIKNIEEENFDDETSYIKEVKKKNKTLVKTKYKIDKPKIIIESWVNKKLECINKNNCNLNLKYEQKTWREKCQWDFWWGDFSIWSKNNCNPSYVKYGTWKFDVSLRVYEKWDYFNFNKSKISFTNLFETEKNEIWNKNLEKNKVIKKEDLEVEREEENIKIEKNSDFEKDVEKENVDKKEILKSIINLQWKIWNNKIINWNVLTCYNNCSINFDWSNSLWNISRYSWDFWNGERFEWKNPSYIKYDYPWKYKIHLLVEWKKWWMDIWEFYVNFIEEESLESFSENEDETFLLSQTYAWDNSLNDSIDYNKENSVDNNMKQITTLLYILIAIFWAILFVLLFKKESII